MGGKEGGESGLDEGGRKLHSSLGGGAERGLDEGGRKLHSSLGGRRKEEGGSSNFNASNFFSPGDITHHGQIRLGKNNASC
jgi:hypothetical protein